MYFLQIKDEVAEELYRMHAESENIFLRTSRHDLEQKVSELIQEIYTLFFPNLSVSAPGETDCSRWFFEQVEKVEQGVAEVICPVNCLHENRENAYCPSDEKRFCRRNAEQLLRKMPEIRRKLECDVQASYEGDPAALGHEEVVLAYPGIFAVAIYRVAHELYRQGVRLIPRMMSEKAHSITGIDIHPGAKIGKGFFVDHGTGVVIGETCEIGDNVKIYQGVTLGALSIPKNTTLSDKSKGKRHPTIEDDVTIYAGATILGGKTVIGKGSLIGGNVWCTESVPPGSKVINRPSVELCYAK